LLPVVDALATERQYLDHLLPVWRALDEHERGTFYISAKLEPVARARGLDARVLDTHRLKGRGLVLVASYGDEVRCDPRPVVLLEHGAGQHYSNGHSSYSGGRGRDKVKLFLCPNTEVAERNRAVYPNATIAIIGSPKLDGWSAASRTPHDPPTIAISFHWQCTVSPEARSAYPHYRESLPELASHYRVIGHGHPRIMPQLEPVYERAGIEAVWDFEEVLERADVYVIDNSSTGIEAMAAGIPVVWMNAPEYRKHITHGGRFWNWTLGIPTVDRPRELAEAIEAARAGGATRREQLVREIYTFTDGQSAKRAAEAIRALNKEGSC
jgi:hypothetical protein